MPSPVRLSAQGRAYVSLVVVAGLTIVGLSLFDLLSRPIGYQWLILVALTLISGSATVRLPSVSASISVSETFVFTAVLLYGPSAGAVTVALDGLVISFWRYRRRRELYRALFNVAAPALSAWISAKAFFLLSGISPLARAATSNLTPADLLGAILPALFVFAVAYFLLNSLLIAAAISLESGLPPIKVWRENFVWLSLNYFCGASVASLLVTYTRGLDLRFVGVTLPLLLLIYLTFRVSMGRVEDANNHVAKVDRMYLATIEAFAMAIDAKDQVTHDHIRRVQRYALGLASEIGVKDAHLLKAIEAAALLHDMGKLAIPEHILNKPGRLTAAEFDKMKEHAAIGAEILSSVDFPYPVVPIVRHHHESWDGTGYPNGLRGPDIPIGARILAVVDCFDALTSDRPYRKALSASEAMEIVKKRAGSMYDPLIVRAFASIQASLQDTEPLDVRGIPSVASARDKAESLHHAHSNSEVSGQSWKDFRLRTADATVLERVAVLMPRTTAVLFEIDRRSDEIVATTARGANAHRWVGMRMACGERLSGWVASHRLAMVNADAGLDFGGDHATYSALEARKCVCIPVGDAERPVGVLTVYSTNEFGADEVRLLSTIVADSRDVDRLRAVRRDF